MRISVNILSILLLCIFSITCYADVTIKIAILDNFKYQKYVTTKYKHYYLEGLNLAAKEASKHKILIKYKIFQYNQEPLSILKLVPEMIAWNPDAIIGPRDSNKFLMLAPYIKGILTISPFATSIAIKKMPNNFFSITLTNEFEAKAIFNFVNLEFPAKDVILLTEADCKSCTEVSEEFIKIWFRNKKQMPSQQFYISQQSSLMLLNDSIKNNHGKKIIILPNNAHDSAVLMARISQLSKDESIFIGGDGWGSWKDTEVGKLGNLRNFSAYHIAPWGLEDHSNNVNFFKAIYLREYGALPNNKLSFIVYQTTMSIIFSYDKYGKNLKGKMQENILKSYQTALIKNRFWFKPLNYIVYQIRLNTNTTYKVINPLINRCAKYEINT